MGKYNLHSHTIYSNNGNHGYSTVDEIIGKAIELGFEKWGFSEHVPFDTYDIPSRTTKENAEKYIESVCAAKAKYKDKIEILCGFEVEALEPEFSYHQELLTDPRIDYLILGNHFAEMESGKSLIYFNYHHKKDGGWDALTRTTKYVDQAINFFNNVDCKYMAHADRGLPLEEEWNAGVVSKIQELIDYCENNNIVLAAGVPAFMAHISDNRPSNFRVEFWKMVAKSNVKVVLEVDYHAPSHIDPKLWKNLGEELKRIGIIPINM